MIVVWTLEFYKQNTKLKLINKLILLRSVYSSANRRVGTSQHNVKSQKRFEVDVQSQRQPDARSTMVQRRPTDFGGQAKDSI